MSLLADIDAAIDDASSRRARRHRDVELDFEREVKPLLAMKAPLLRGRHRAVADELQSLTRSEAAALRPAGKARTRDAMRKAIARIQEVDPIKPGKRGAALTYSRRWLEKNGLCPSVHPEG